MSNVAMLPITVEDFENWMSSVPEQEWGMRNITTRIDGVEWRLLEQPRSRWHHFETMEQAIKAAQEWSVQPYADVDGLVTYFDLTKTVHGTCAHVNPKFKDAKALIVIIFKSSSDA